MRQRKEAATAAPRAFWPSLTGRIGLFVGTLSLILMFANVQAASAWHLTSVSPTSGCPGTEVAFTGTSFSGSSSKVQWRDPSSLVFSSQETIAKVTSSTKATGIVPFFLQTEGSGVGTTAIDGSNTVVFTFNQLQNCFKSGAVVTGPTGPTGKQPVQPEPQRRDRSHGSYRGHR